MTHAEGKDADVPLLETRGLKKYFKTSQGLLHAVDDINFTIKAGKTLGVVGESGCGKSTLGRVVLRLLEPTAGEIFYRGQNFAKNDEKQMFAIRKKMQMIFQDPYSSLNPRMTVSDIIAEPIRVGKTYCSRSDLEEQVFALMEMVGLAERFVNTYPHELDGGRRQRIGIARALSVHPEFVVCDEPVSALDVSIQAQILNLLMDLQEEQNLTYMFITHNLSVVKHIASDIAVMYLGQCVELCTSDMLFEKPMHPYTRALLDAIPVPDLGERYKHVNIIKGEVSNPISPKPGCRFAARCPHVRSICTAGPLPLAEVEPGHLVTCILQLCGEIR